jgi:hypothetical protein
MLNGWTAPIAVGSSEARVNPMRCQIVGVPAMWHVFSRHGQARPRARPAGDVEDRRGIAFRGDQPGASGACKRVPSQMMPPRSPGVIPP